MFIIGQVMIDIQTRGGAIVCFPIVVYITHTSCGGSSIVYLPIAVLVTGKSKA